MLAPRGPGVLVTLAALSLSAYLHARGISALVGGGLAAPRVVSLAPPPSPEAAPVPRSAAVILARNPFDSDTGALDPAAAGPDVPPPLGGMPACEGVQVLAIAAADVPASSLALLREEGALEPRLRGVGADVVAIEPGVVVLDRGGTTCAARIFRPAVAPAASTSAARSPSPADRDASASRPPRGLPPGVAALGPTSFAVDRGARDALLEGAADWLKTVSARPEKAPDGHGLLGLRIAGVAAGSPVEGLGVHGGDVITSVNGIALSSPERMLEALGRVRTADHLGVVVQRGGHEVQLDYAVR